MSTGSTGSTATEVRPDRLHSRDFRLIWLGESTSALGSSVTAVALPLVALTVLHADVVAIGFLSAVAWLPWLVVGLPAGAWVDRLSRRRVMIVCDVVSLALFASVPVAVWLGALTMTQLLVVAVGAGVCKVFFSTAYRAFLPALVDDDELVAANAKLQGAESAAQIAGPGLGGVIAQAFGAANGLALDAVTFVVSLVCLRRIEAEEPPVPHSRRRLRTEIGEGLRFVARDALLRINVLFGAIANLVLIGYQVIVVVFLVNGVGLSPGVVGVLLAVGSVGGVLGALLVPRLAKRIGTGRALLVCMMGAPPFALLIPFAAHDWRLALFVAGELGLDAGVVAGNVLRSGFMQAYCPRELMGRVTTSLQVVNYGAIPLGAVLGGFLAGALGYRGALWLLFGTFVAATSMLLFSPLRTYRELPTRADVLSEGAGSIGSRAGRGRSARRARPRAARGRDRRPRPRLHPRRRRDGQDPGHHAPHRLRRPRRGGSSRPAPRRHVHRPRGR